MLICNSILNVLLAILVIQQEEYGTRSTKRIVQNVTMLSYLLAFSHSIFSHIATLGHLIMSEINSQFAILLIILFYLNLNSKLYLVSTNLPFSPFLHTVS
jgi:hypothetical protein